MNTDSLLQPDVVLSPFNLRIDSLWADVRALLLSQTIQHFQKALLVRIKVFSVIFSSL